MFFFVLHVSSPFSFCLSVFPSFLSTVPVSVSLSSPSLSDPSNKNSQLKFPLLPQTVIDEGFVIESQSEAELPERLLCTSRFIYTKIERVCTPVTADMITGAADDDDGESVLSGTQGDSTDSTDESGESGAERGEGEERGEM